MYFINKRLLRSQVYSIPWQITNHNKNFVFFFRQISFTRVMFATESITIEYTAFCRELLHVYNRKNYFKQVHQIKMTNVSVILEHEPFSVCIFLII